MQMTTEHYRSLIGYRPNFQGLMGGVPFDAQFRGDLCANGESALHVRYGQERQGLYRCVAGPEFKICKMGPLCGGPVVLLQAEMKVNGWGCEDYYMKNIDVAENDVPRVVADLLNKAKDAYKY